MNSTKLFITALAACILTGCTSSIATVSPAHFEEEVLLVGQRMEDLGYGLSGKFSEEVNEIYATDATDNGSDLRNDYYWYDTYLFSDSVGNTASFQVRYKRDSDRQSVPYLHNICVVGCECSRSGDYARVCGGDGAVQPLGGIAPDQQSTIRNETSTFWWLAGSLFGSFTLGLILLTL